MRRISLITLVVATLLIGICVLVFLNEPPATSGSERPHNGSTSTQEGANRMVALEGEQKSGGPTEGLTEKQKAAVEEFEHAFLELKSLREAADKILLEHHQRHPLIDGSQTAASRFQVAVGTNEVLNNRYYDLQKKDGNLKRALLDADNTFAQFILLQTLLNGATELDGVKLDARAAQATRELMADRGYFDEMILHLSEALEGQLTDHELAGIKSASNADEFVAAGTRLRPKLEEKYQAKLKELWPENADLVQFARLKAYGGRLNLIAGTYKQMWMREVEEKAAPQSVSYEQTVERLKRCYEACRDKPEIAGSMMHRLAALGTYIGTAYDTKNAR